ncbi:MAG: hypothetical protein KDC11_03525, partial [Chitinophagaceae bacterium]|nr:hypothetical protein [Chitinophagaceae bacterium]
RNANNKRLHVEMCLIRLCYLLQATQLEAEKKNTGNVVAPPTPQPKPAHPAVNKQPQVQQPEPVPQNEPVKKQEPEAATVPKATQSTPAYQPAKKPENNGNGRARRISSSLLDEIDEAVNNAADMQVEQKELTQEVVSVTYESYKKTVLEANKMMLYAQLDIMTAEYHAPDEVRIISPTDLTDTYAKDNRNDILDYFREQTGCMVRVTTEVRIDETIEAEQKERILSKPEIFEEMIKKNPKLAALRDALGLQIDY